LRCDKLTSSTKKAMGTLAWRIITVDIVTMWDAMDHFDEPRESILSIKNGIREGGCLVIVRGDYQSGNKLERGPKCWGYQLNYRWYSSPDKLEYFFSDPGIKYCRVHREVLRIGREGMVNYMGPSRYRHLREVGRSPWQLISILKRYRGLKQASQCNFSGLDICVVIAST